VSLNILLATVWAFTACYGDSFTFTVILIFEEFSPVGWSGYVVVAEPHISRECVSSIFRLRE
jgi:S-adenosylmethionine/arginine decarboxylase-like enzyme